MKSGIVVMIAVAGKDTLLERTLHSLNNCYKPKSYKCSLIIENGKKFNAEEICKSYSKSLNIKYIYYPIGNKSEALNFGIKHLDENDLILFTDDDIRFDEYILVEYDRVFKSYKNSFFGGTVKPEYEKKAPPDYLLSFLPTTTQEWPKNGSERINKFLGANWAAFVDDIKNAGEFDPRFGPGTKPRRTGQEHQMQEALVKRLKAKPVYLQNAIVYHFIPEKKSNVSFALNRLYQYGIKNAVKNKHEKNIYFIIKELLIIMLKINLRFVLYIFSFSKKNLMSFLAELNILRGYIRGYLFIK